MYAPKLETIWVRGCWCLKRLPATTEALTAPTADQSWTVRRSGGTRDGKKARHHRSLFRPRHSKYYKKTLLRSSVLR
jgi:hypothetical protein